MRGLITIFSSLALVVLAGQASAQSARKMAEHGDWATYSYQAQNGKVCYVLTVPKPKSMQPASVDHGDMFFFVSQRPGQAVSFEPQFIAGYALREGSKVRSPSAPRSSPCSPRASRPGSRTPPRSRC